MKRSLKTSMLAGIFACLGFAVIVGHIQAGGATKVQSGQIVGGVQSDSKNQILATFVELGSVNCVPCKMMQPVMKEIEQEYGDQVKVVFHDVWTNEGKPFGEQYKIRAIPTQVFLDKGGKEYFRHMGFFPKEEIVKVLEKQGIKMAMSEEKSPRTPSSSAAEEVAAMMPKRLRVARRSV